MGIRALSEKAMTEGEGVLRLAPTWVPRSFCRPGKRLKLHPDDYYKLGLERGGIDERWFASTTKAQNGPLTAEDEGLSYVIVDENMHEKILLKDLIDELKDEVIGDMLWQKYHRWPMFSKFFDNLGPLPHHIHHRDEHAKLVGSSGKPEMYFFPSQMNNYPGEFAFTFLGLNPDMTRPELKQILIDFSKGDNKLVDRSRAFKLTLDTGWDVPPGLLHAPGSLCTYEPQFASDVFAMYQSILLHEHTVPIDLLWKDCPSDKIGDFDYLVDVVDWELNVDPDLARTRFMAPIPAGDSDRALIEGYLDEWICYKCAEVSAKRLTILPGKTVTVRDSSAYGFILLEGFGKFGSWEIETPTLIRYGSLTNDEFFVSEKAARRGVVIVNRSNTQPLVLLKHFAENSDFNMLNVK